MYSIKSILTKNPIQISGTIQTILNFLVIAGAVHLDSKVVAGANGVLLSVLGLFIVTTTTNTAKLNEFFEPSTDTTQTQEYS